jgi:hypothetical protein
MRLSAFVGQAFRPAIACAALCAGPVSLLAQQQQQQQPPPPPLNPTQEVAGQQPQGAAIEMGPAKLRIGGYVGLTAITRSTTSGGGTGTRFAEIPYSDTLDGNVSNTRLTAESSRLSIRVDADFPDDRPRFRALSGYFEMDFSGVTPGNVEITSTSAGMRLRHAFAEVRYRTSWFLSVGQGFSLMTPAKDQLSMWPADMELSQAVDTNYLAGTVWGRYPQFRIEWRPKKAFNWAVSVENPEQEIGNGMVALPACCASDINAQYNNGNSGTTDPNFLPDFVSRIAFNRGRLHMDAGGVVRTFRNAIAPYNDAFKTVGGGGSVNAAVHAAPGTKIIVQGATGSGLGRYIGGLAPDVVFHADGSIDPLRSGSWVSGFEQQVTGHTSIGGYYSGVMIEDAYEHDTGGAYIGYGFPGSPLTNNKRLDEVTGTFSTLAMSTPTRGSAQLAIQMSWLRREPWSQGSGPPTATAVLFFAQVRYNLP